MEQERAKGTSSGICSYIGGVDIPQELLACAITHKLPIPHLCLNIPYFCSAHCFKGILFLVITASDTGIMVMPTEVISTAEAMKSVDAPSLSPESLMKSIEVRSPGVCHLMRLPLELRDLIYRMLLTTPYCTNLATTRYRIGPVFEFHLHTAILLVNKQISEEAARILYHGNDFILLRSHGLNLSLDKVPGFDCHSELERRISRPLLQIEIRNTDLSRVKLRDPDTLLTTPEGLQSVIGVIWALVYDNPYAREVHHRDLSLSLDFNFKTGARYKALSDLVLKPWEMVNGLQELELTGDIKEPTRECLEKSIMKGPFQSEVAACLKNYHSLADQYFQQENYDAARWWWHLLGTYRAYLFNLTTYPFIRNDKVVEGREFIKDVLSESLPTYFDGKLKTIKACLHQSKYEEAAGYASEVWAEYHSIYVQFGYHCGDLNHNMSRKFFFSLCFLDHATRQDKRQVEFLKKCVIEEPE
jgi:hypothetical protein